MRFWQALVIAYLSSGLVWAAHFDAYWPRMGADAVIAIGGGMLWTFFKWAHKC